MTDHTQRGTGSTISSALHQLHPIPTGAAAEHHQPSGHFESAQRDKGRDCERGVGPALNAVGPDWID